MKTMTCKQLGGACDQTFQAETFQEIAELSKKHGMEMYQAGDQKHINAMMEMQKRMSTPEQMNKWMLDKQLEFDALSAE